MVWWMSIMVREYSDEGLFCCGSILVREYSCEGVLWWGTILVREYSNKKIYLVRDLSGGKWLWFGSVGSPGSSGTWYWSRLSILSRDIHTLCLQLGDKSSKGIKDQADRIIRNSLMALHKAVKTDWTLCKLWNITKCFSTWHKTLYFGDKDVSKYILLLFLHTQMENCMICFQFWQYIVRG